MNVVNFDLNKLNLYGIRIPFQSLFERFKGYFDSLVFFNIQTNKMSK